MVSLTTSVISIPCGFFLDCANFAVTKAFQRDLRIGARIVTIAVQLCVRYCLRDNF
jgi:hypothetical protein